jgi:hypothetical protein
LHHISEKVLFFIDCSPIKLSFAKNLTPLLKSRKLDFALIFAVSENQLNSILSDIMGAMKEETRLWVAHPKLTSKISTDLNRDSSWNKLNDIGYEAVETVSLDHVWQAISFVKAELEVVEEEVKIVAKKSKKAVVAA